MSRRPPVAPESLRGRLLERAHAVGERLAAFGAREARALFVLGSGLGQIAEALEDRETLPARDVPDVPGSRVPGHAGRFVLGRLEGATVLLQEGRAHLYEGWSAHDVTRVVRACAGIGVAHLVLTNSAGGLRSDARPGDLLVLEDHVSLQGRPPLLAGEEVAGRAYDPEWCADLEEAGRDHPRPPARGVYAGLLGPSYETPAEIRMLRRLGADAVGMSTVAEAAVGFALGMRVGAVACITNLAAGLGEAPLSHADVVAAGREASARLAALLSRALASRFVREVARSARKR